MGLNILAIEGTNDPKYLEKNNGSLEGLEMKNEGEQLRKPGYRGWGAMPARVPHPSRCMMRVGASRLTECQGRQFSPFSPHIFVLVPK